MSEAIPTLREMRDELGALLALYEDAYTRWLAIAEAQGEALRRADGRGVERHATALRGVMEDVSRLEPRRGALVNAAAAALGLAKGSRPVTLRDVARALPVPDAGALAARAASVRELAGRAHERTSSLAGATRGLLWHVEGLVRHAARHLSHAGTYSARGRVEVGGTVVSSLDVRS
ncbi:MAG: flagellar export chaperone FlgN [Planctomycetota bacterium]|nr:flagellar export chaperone FlgN [Planctomycetota bacterium]